MPKNKANRRSCYMGSGTQSQQRPTSSPTTLQCYLRSQSTRFLTGAHNGHNVGHKSPATLSSSWQNGRTVVHVLHVVVWLLYTTWDPLVVLCEQQRNTVRTQIHIYLKIHTNNRYIRKQKIYMCTYRYKHIYVCMCTQKT